MSIDSYRSLKTIRSVRSNISPRTPPQPRKTSITSIQSGTSMADALRGMKVPVTRLSQDSISRSKSKAKKVELLLTRNMSSSQLELRSSRYEGSVLRELNHWCVPRSEFKDDADISMHPSYNMKEFSYDLNCFVRYLDSQDKYDKQFLREMVHFIANQPNICDQYFLKRILCYKTRWPPLHTKRELNNFVTKFFQLTPRQKRRVDYLMKTDLSLGC